MEEEEDNRGSRGRVQDKGGGGVQPRTHVLAAESHITWMSLCTSEFFARIPGGVCKPKTILKSNVFFPLFVDFFIECQPYK